MPRVTPEKIVTKLFAGLQNFPKAGGVFDIGVDGKIEKFEGAIDSLGGAGLIALSGPFEGAGDFAADVAHLVSDRMGGPVPAGLFAVDVV